MSDLSELRGRDLARAAMKDPAIRRDVYVFMSRYRDALHAQALERFRPQGSQITDFSTQFRDQVVSMLDCALLEYAPRVRAKSPDLPFDDFCRAAYAYMLNVIRTQLTAEFYSEVSTVGSGSRSRVRKDPMDGFEVEHEQSDLVNDYAEAGLGTTGMSLGFGDPMVQEDHEADISRLRQSLVGAVAARLEELTPLKKEAMELVIVHDLTYDDAASRMGVTAEKVRRHIKEAVDFLTGDARAPA